MTASTKSKKTSEVSTTAIRDDKLYIENTVLRISGALFCHDPKRASSRSAEIEINADKGEKRIVIRPDPKLGQPGQLAHKIFVALIKKHSDYGRPVRREISFTRRELGRLIGRKGWGGEDSEQLSRALHEIHHTFVTAHFKRADGRNIEHSFNLLPEILLERREFASDPIEACTVTLAAPIVSSLEDEHFTCLNYSTMSHLGTIGQALMMRLFFHFANHYDGHTRRSLKFDKRYDDICAEWLGGLTVLKYRYRIVNEQLGRHLDQLIASGFLAGYRITEAKTRAGFVISFLPGDAFFQDYDRFYRQRRQGGLQFEFHDDQRSIGEPLRVAYLFIEKRTGHSSPSIGYVPSKDVETAKQLLAELPFAEIPRFFDYALDQASRTNFAVQTLGGIKQYLAGYLAQRRQRETRRLLAAAHEAKRREQEEQEEYFQSRRREALRLFESLPTGERERIERLAAERANAFEGSLRERQLHFSKVSFTIEHYGASLQSFEQWKATRLAA
jgi:hypothetical protein